ncbi:hypothetical protein L5C70_07185 [Pseudomonas aeruginosa]|nr:hypothetical protein [Pseudomonas aeruginosa]MDG4270610.1 hypothetical protein [Pseudomonas aeruginosa]
MSEVKRFDVWSLRSLIQGEQAVMGYEVVLASDYDALAAKLAMAEDAAAKGDAARQQCAGMEMEIKELRGAADHWEAESRALQKLRDAALAKLAELEKQEPAATVAKVPGEDWNSLDFHLDLQGMLPGTKLYTTPVAQAQHSVPDDVETFLDEVRAELLRARSKFPGDRIMTIALAEEFGELCKAVLDEPAANVRKEAVQTAVMAARVVLDGDGSVTAWRAERGLDPLAAAPGKEVPQAWLDVQAERKRQVEVEGWTPEHDDAHSHGQMAQAAGCYALHAGGIDTDWPGGIRNGSALFWPWDKDWWKPTTTRRDLVKACTLGLAEIERLDRVAASQGGPSDA